MPKGQNKKNSFKPSTLYIALLLVKIIFIKIGCIPILLFLSLRTISVAIFNVLGRLVSSGVERLLRRSLHSLLAMTRILRFQKNRIRGRPKKFRLSKRFKVTLALSTIIIFLFSYTVFILTAAYQLPNPNRLIYSQSPLNTQIYDRNGNLLYNLYDDTNRSLVKLPEIPKNLIQATLAIEDRNFYHHIGIDPAAIVRAFYHNMKNDNLEGASTLTQQLIKNSLLTPEKSYSRKLKEAILALWTERIYSKDEILQMYLNEAPYGGSLMGIAAASRTYFGKSPAELSLAESSYLAGLPASPTQFSPYGSRPELAKFRQKEVLSEMVKNKYITPTEADKAFAEDLHIKPLANDIHAPHFVFYIKELLTEKYGPRLVSQGGLKVYTSLDLNLQEEVENIVTSEIDKLTALNVKNGAAMVLDGQNGQILAMVGSRDYHYPAFGNYNVALSPRQPGSSIKPITYAVALSKGFNPSSLILDTPVTFKDEWGNGYSPVNYDGTFHGPVTLRQALGSSLNIPAVKLLATVGVDSVVQAARDLGITTFANAQSAGLALTLGAADVKMIDMMGVYDAFSQNGILHSPSGILKVTDSENRVLEEFKNSQKQVLSPQTAYLITNILSDDKARQMAFGANSLLNIPGYEVAVKTGTSDNKRDNWTFGYTPKYVVGVWVGNPDNSPMNPQLTSGITGAAPIWNKIIHTLVDNTQPLAFKRPSGITDTQVSGKKDLKAKDILPKAMVRTTKDEGKTVFSDAYSSYATSSAQPEIQAGPANPTQPNL